MTDIEGRHFNSTYTTEADLADKFLAYTRGGEWEKVEKLCQQDVKFCSMIIDNSRGTTLHMAVNVNNISVVRSLVGLILRHGEMEALMMENEKGDTPLHIAASRGFREICECIIGESFERKELIYIRNKKGETPLFLASLSWQKQAFVHLWDVYDCDSKYEFYPYSKDLIRNNGDSILHCAIQREFFDLALIILHKYPFLGAIATKKGFTPLKLLATRPSAFESGCKMIWWKKILYLCIHMENLNVKEVVTFYGMKQDPPPTLRYPENYDTCYFSLDKCKKYVYLLLNIHEQPPTNSKLQNKPITDQHQQINKSVPSDKQHINMPSDPELLPENYATCLWFLKFAYIYILGLSGVGVDEVRKLKQKHKWSSQLLTFFMEDTSYYFGTGTKPLENESELDVEAFDNQNKDEVHNTNENPNEGKKQTEEMVIAITKTILAVKNKLEDEKKSKTLKSETPILTAARYGIVEMVNVLVKKIPSSIDEINMENKNILLVAVENKKTVVVKSLKKFFEEGNKKTIFDNLIQEVDNENNTVLHLAATPSDHNWNIPGAALHMMWHIKWFLYVKGLVPEHFTVRTNKDDKTAAEILKVSYIPLVEKGSEWLKDTSESCSVVAALLAGVSFATSSTVPSGNKGETGEPALEGKLAFDAFAWSSVISLCFSVTALIMFLSILTSRKEAKDFKIDLPRKLLFGLSSLFLSILAMFITFYSGHFFLIDQKYKNIVFLVYTVTCFPVTLYAIAQLPLYIDLLRGIVTKIPMTIAKGEEF